MKFYLYVCSLNNSIYNFVPLSLGVVELVTCMCICMSSYCHSIVPSEFLFGFDNPWIFTDVIHAVEGPDSI